MLSVGRGNFFPAYGTVQQLLKGMYFLCILNVKRRKKHWTAYMNSSASLAWQYLLFKQPKLQNEHGLSRNLNKRKSFAKKHSRTAKQWSPSYRQRKGMCKNLLPRKGELHCLLVLPRICTLEHWSDFTVQTDSTCSFHFLVGLFKEQLIINIGLPSFVKQRIL